VDVSGSGEPANLDVSGSGEPAVVSEIADLPVDEPGVGEATMAMEAEAPVQRHVEPARAPMFPIDEGTEGTRTRLKTNLLPLKIEVRTVYHFKITTMMFEDRNAEIKNKDLRRKVVQKLGTHEFQEETALAYDAKDNVYGVFDGGLILGSSVEKKVEVYERKFVKVGLKLVNEMDVQSLLAYIRDPLTFSPRQDVLNMLSCVFQTSPASRYLVVRNGFFREGNDARPWGPGVDAWLGYTMVPKALRLGVHLSFNHSRTAVYREIGVIEWLDSLRIYLRAPLSERDWRRISKELKNMYVKTIHRPQDLDKPRKINAVTPESAERIFFKDRDGNDISVAQYFAELYRPLNFPHLPCLDLTQRKRDGPNIWVPLEVCVIIRGQRRRSDPTDEMNAERLRLESIGAEERMAMTDRLVADANFADDPVLKAFKIQVNPRISDLPARLLKAPAVKYGTRSLNEGDRFRPSKGVWNMRDHRVYKSDAPLTRWGVLCLDPHKRRNDVDAFIRELVNLGNENGMKISGPLSVEYGDNVPDADPVRSLAATVSSLDLNSDGQALLKPNDADKKECQMLLVIKPDMDNNVYTTVKTVGDSVMGFPSQVVQARYVGPHTNRQYHSNLLLKMNGKMGGANHVLGDDLCPRITENVYMICGMALSTGKKRRREGLVQGPAVAAVVATVDPEMTKFAHAHCMQSDVRHVEDAGHLFKQVIGEFSSAWKNLPDVLIIYREGLSEGGFLIADAEQNYFHTELESILKGCRDIRPDYQPKIVFIVVSKRNKTFFVAGPDAGDEKGNCQSGVVIDTDVVSPRLNEFFLISHPGLKGTSRPTKYTVLVDDIGFTADEIQQFCFHQCFTFARCARAVSIVPTVYYAQLYALRVFLLSGTDDGTESVISDDLRGPQAHYNHVPTHSNLSDRLFFI